MIKNVKILGISGRIGESESCFCIKRTLDGVIFARKGKSESYDFENFWKFDEKESVMGIKIKKFSKSKD